MNNKESKRFIAYEVLTILGMLALLLLVCRLWPILLLVILGIFIAALKLLFLSAKKVVVLPPLPQLPAHVPTERDVQDLAYITVQHRITELVSAKYPDARWVWATPDAKANITAGKEVSILLNRAGGYRQAHVVIQGLQVCGLAYQRDPEEPDSVDETDAVDCAEKTATEVPEPVEQQPINYEYIAFEWVDAHAMELNSRCNECIAQGVSVLQVKPEELPTLESWMNICQELERNGMKGCECTSEGITIYLKQ